MTAGPIAEDIGKVGGTKVIDATLLPRREVLSSWYSALFDI